MNYFDWAATSPMSEASIQAYSTTALNYIGNPSAIYAEGKKAKDKLEAQREKIAKQLGVANSTIYFTSGGTESNSIILNSLLRLQSPGEVILTRMEHSAISEYERLLKEKGFKIRYLNCPKGTVDPEKLKEMLNNDTRMVVCMLVNNVLGTIQDLKRISEIVRAYPSPRKIHVHTDAVQAIGKFNIDLMDLGVDSAAFSAHKFCGPRGVGILYNKNERVYPLSAAGGQERGIRGGTENLAGIVAMETSLENILSNVETNYAKVLKLRNYLEQELQAGGFTLLSPSYQSKVEFSPYILTVSSSVPAEVFVRILDKEGFYVSSGSACSNNVKSKNENILKVMGFQEKVALGAIRISFGPTSEMESVKELSKTMIRVRQMLAV